MSNHGDYQNLPDHEVPYADATVVSGNRLGHDLVGTILEANGRESFVVPVSTLRAGDVVEIGYADPDSPSETKSIRFAVDDVDWTDAEVYDGVPDVRISFQGKGVEGFPETAYLRGTNFTPNGSMHQPSVLRQGGHLRVATPMTEDSFARRYVFDWPIASVTVSRPDDGELREVINTGTGLGREETPLDARPQARRIGARARAAISRWRNKRHN